MPTPTTDAGEAKKTPTRRASSASTASSNGHGAYVMPIVHITVPENAVNAGFWAALGGAAVLGAIDLPLAALIGAGVLVARHHSSG
ncbi:MAG: hypothetical protein ACLQPH_10470 [Acidimicrobiales bacterium]